MKGEIFGSMENFWHIIVNPAASGGQARRLWPRIERSLQELGFSYSVQFTQRPMHAADLAEEAVWKGARAVMAIGGDGTAHEAANGILRQEAVPSKEVAFALLPIGTGNDWARQWGLPSDPQAVLKRILTAEPRFQDAGRIVFQKNGQTTERFFINVAGLAYDGFIAREAERQGKKGPLAYYFLILKCLWRYRLSKARIVIDGGERTVEDFFYTVNAGICRFSGGGMRLVPHAVPDDGLFALTMAKKMSKLQVILATPKFYDGQIGAHPKVEAGQCRRLRIETLDGEPPVLAEADGEFLGETPCELFLMEKALKIVV